MSCKKPEFQKAIWGAIPLIRDSESSPWKVDPENEVAYWKGLRSEMLRITQSDADVSQIRELLKKIINNYATEIPGNFDPRTYRLASNVLPVFFSRVLNAAEFGIFRGWFTDKHQLHDKIKLTGEINSVRALTKKGTVIILPTHFSNLDSILIGWALEMLGLPPHIYGAGLNLFNNKFLHGSVVIKYRSYKINSGFKI